MRAKSVVAVALAMAACALTAPRADAATAYSLYSYDLSQTSGSIVANGAAAFTAVPLQLIGTWSPTPTGVYFTGDQTSQGSVGKAKPNTGSTINVAETKSVGVAIRFTYTAPVAGCFSDSPNLTQIGRFGNNVAQVKLQLSNCGISKTAVYPQCRVAGSQTPTSVWPRKSSVALVDGTTYVVHCMEGVTTTGTRTFILRVTPLGSATTTNQWTVPSPGAITSTSALSVANKYPLPSGSANTDQYVGEVQKVAYCMAGTPGLISGCLSTEIPTS